MDKPEQDANRKFEGGVFSGGALQEEKPEQDLRMDNYFDYACHQPGKQQGGFTGRPPEENPQSEEERNKEADSGKNPGWQDMQPDGAGPGSGNVRREPNWQQEQGGRQEQAWENRQSSIHNQGYQLGYQRGNPGMGMPLYHGNGCGDCRCIHCPNGRRSGHTMPEILSLVAVVGLVIAFLATVLCLIKVSSGRPADSPADKEAGTSYENRSSKGDAEGWYGENPMPEAGSNGDYYGEIADAIRTDLDYSIEWENYEYEGNGDSVMIAVDYPVIQGDVPNLDAINDIIDDETEYFEEYYKEYSKYMMPEERFFVYSEGYVTFMDPEVMSVVFCEMIYTDYWADYGLYCLNIDMENGVVLDNNSIIDINDEFAVDFRKRCRQQNGTVNALDSMTDQEIVYYLTSGGTSILFYTPMGIEVGMNFGEYYVTVTYRDYERYLQKY